MSINQKYCSNSRNPAKLTRKNLESTNNKKSKYWTKQILEQNWKIAPLDTGWYIGIGLLYYYYSIGRLRNLAFENEDGEWEQFNETKTHEIFSFFFARQNKLPENSLMCVGEV